MRGLFARGDLRCLLLTLLPGGLLERSQTALGFIPDHPKALMEKLPTPLVEWSRAEVTSGGIMKFHFHALALAVAWLAVAPTSALAWDAEGHRIIAHLAYERLTPRAKAAVAELAKHSPEQDTPSCPVASLEDASTWPDCIRPLHGRFEYLAVMHYEDVPICGAALKATYCPDGKCIIGHRGRGHLPANPEV